MNFQHSALTGGEKRRQLGCCIISQIPNLMVWFMSSLISVKVFTQKLGALTYISKLCWLANCNASVLTADFLSLPPPPPHPPVLPWYNHTGWMGVKHQVTYLLTPLPTLHVHAWCCSCCFPFIFLLPKTDKWISIIISIFLKWVKNTLLNCKTGVSLPCRMWKMESPAKTTLRLKSITNKHNYNQSFLGECMYAQHTQKRPCGHVKILMWKEMFSCMHVSHVNNCHSHIL